MKKINLLENLINTKENITLDNIFEIVNFDNDFSSIMDFHTFLIEKVSQIQKNENSEENAKLLNNNCNLKAIDNKFENGKSANSIYLISNENSVTYAFGDIHGDSICLYHFLKNIDFVNRCKNGEKINIIFVGDYVDRGKAPFKVLEALLILKMLFPSNVFMLRGNHDGGTVISETEYKLCVGRDKTMTDDEYFMGYTFNQLTQLKVNKEFLRRYLIFLYSLNNVAFLFSQGEVIMFVHGGIPRAVDDKYDYLNSISDLTSDDIKDILNDPPYYNMLWSDPAKSPDDVRQTRRFYFYENQYYNFADKFGIDNLIRGHQAFEEGCRYFFNNKIINIFSSGYSQYEKNETAYNDINPCIIKIEGKEKTILHI